MCERLLSVVLVLALLSSVNSALFEGCWMNGAEEAHAALIQLPQTGQTTCYDDIGGVIPCASTGQDGEKRAGVGWDAAIRFTDNGNGTITDTLTGLTWLKNANCTDSLGGVDKAGGLLNWADALTWSNNLATASCDLTDGSTVGQWRLPTRKELKSLISWGEVNNDTWLISKGFNVFLAGAYWSSSTYANNTIYPEFAWYVGIDDGFIDFFDKVTPLNVWPVLSP